MADISDKLDQIAEQFACKVDLATSELVSYLRELVKGKTAAESLELLRTMYDEAPAALQQVPAKDKKMFCTINF